MGIGSHTTPIQGKSDDYATPRSIVEPLGPFDLDPCASLNQPWPCAERSFNVNENGLIRPWTGRVWLNPPYGKRIVDWMEKLAHHGNGIALVFARTETRWFFKSVWPRATALLFLEGRITFYRTDGSRMPNGHNSGGPSVLIAYGRENAKALYHSGLKGAFVKEIQRQ